MTRALATIRRINELRSIEGADRIELAIVDGWQVIVKKGEYQVNDLAVYCEVDSWIPHSLAPFLTKSGNQPKIYQGVEGQRLKSMKMKGVLSQGLIIDISSVYSLDPADYDHVFLEGDDVTELLGILKWEKEIPVHLQGIQRGSFPTEIYKTDQERIQNLTKKFEELKNYTWEVTEKLHGSSMTIYIDLEGKLHVCSRNVDLVESDDNTYWQVAKKEFDFDFYINNVPYHNGVAIQGELIGPGINGNQYGLSEATFLVFDMQQCYHPSERYCPAEMRRYNSEYIKLKHVPVIHEEFKIPVDWTIENMLKYAEGKSALNGSEREGLVFKCIEDPELSFKVVSNKWLLNGGEDQ